MGEGGSGGGKQWRRRVGSERRSAWRSMEKRPLEAGLVILLWPTRCGEGNVEGISSTVKERCGGEVEVREKVVFDLIG